MFKRGVQDDLLQVAKTVADKVYVPFLAKQEEIRRRKAREEAERRALELEKARLEAERLAREAEEQRRAAEQARIDAEAKRLEAERLAAPVAQHEPEVATQMIASVAIAQEEAALGEEIAAATSHDLAVAQNAADEAAAQVAAAERAQELAARTATGSTTDLSRTRGAGGSVASLKTTWEFEVLDLSKVPLKYLTINEAMIRADIRGEQGEREIPGLRIYPVQSARVR
jgi:membrane protein involved in colicin uptake